MIWLKPESTSHINLISVSTLVLKKTSTQWKKRYVHFVKSKSTDIHESRRLYLKWKKQLCPFRVNGKEESYFSYLWLQLTI